ncbi:hypothetical protein MJO28_001073 [Puccinia striiformis f. sp. tritici]|uniref:Uncharacterized protein n=2 Tax=Puccinia striiformis f. sp. tritici TaxID=168172 RepID=A0ACC0F0S9_9BASI|nr:hypothetical protein MJO28_001073 [Puccinia striiformis f. sp. tritici]
MGFDKLCWTRDIDIGRQAAVRRSEKGLQLHDAQSLHFLEASNVECEFRVVDHPQRFKPGHLVGWFPDRKIYISRAAVDLNRTSHSFHLAQNFQFLHIEDLTLPGMIKVLLPFIIFSVLLNLPTTVLNHGGPSKLHTRQVVARPSALRNLEVREPPVVPQSKPCNQVLLEYTFANSYGSPANTIYLPPTDCGPPGDWASVIFNLTTTSIGRQYDRLGRLYLNDIEIWRTSTAEPTPTGIVWTMTRDVSKYIPLLSSPGLLSLDIGNIVDKSVNLTGAFEVTLSAKFYPSTQLFPTSKKADKIINWGRGTGSNMSQFLTFPQNLESAFVELFASGAAQEEYTNVPDEYSKQLDPDNTGNVVVGKGSFREVQVWIDSRLAGVAYPFPVIYTGGILMAWWRPIAGIGAFDAPTYILDISPFIPYLSDSKAHNFTMMVEGQGENRSINSEWIFSGSVFMTLDPSGARTTGDIISYSTDSNTTVDPSPKGLNFSPDTDSNDSINFVTESYRKLSISSILITGSGEPRLVKFEQDFSYMNEQSWIPRGDYQSVSLSSKGTSFSTHDDRVITKDSFDFPFNLNISTVAVAKANQTKIVGNLTHTFRRSQSFSLSSNLGQVNIDTTQRSGGELLLNSNGRVIGGLGRTAQSFIYNDGRNETYTRNIEVSNVTEVVKDEESGTLSSPHTSKSNVLSNVPQDGDDIEGCPYRVLRKASFDTLANDVQNQFVLQTNH